MDKFCESCGQSLAAAPLRGLDWGDFGLQIRLEMARRNISYRNLAADIGSDQATIHRVAKHGRPVRVETYLALAEWLKKDTIP